MFQQILWFLPSILTRSLQWWVSRCSTGFCFDLSIYSWYLLSSSVYLWFSFNETECLFSGCCLWGWGLCGVWWIRFQTLCWRWFLNTNFLFTFCAPLCCCFVKYIFSFAEALSRLDAVIRHPNALHSDNVMAYDNAVSALGKICQFHRDSINAAQVVDILMLNFSIVSFEVLVCEYRRVTKICLFEVNKNLFFFLEKGT